MLPEPIRKYEPFSQGQPPCMAVETMTAGNAAAGRGSMAQRINVCVPPPLDPVTAMRRWIDIPANSPRSPTLESRS